MSRMLLKVLTDDEVQKPHQKTLEVLAKVGFKVTHIERGRV